MVLILSSRQAGCDHRSVTFRHAAGSGTGRVKRITLA
jgi:hypothetical protein